MLGQTASSEALCFLQALDASELEFEGLSHDHLFEAVPDEGEDEADVFDPLGWGGGLDLVEQLCVLCLCCSARLGCTPVLAVLRRVGSLCRPVSVPIRPGDSGDSGVCVVRPLRRHRQFRRLTQASQALHLCSLGYTGTHRFCPPPGPPPRRRSHAVRVGSIP